MKILPFHSCYRFPSVQICIFSKSIQSFIFTNVMRLPVPPQFCWIFSIFVHQLSKWYSIAVLICTSWVVVRLKIFSCVYQSLYLLLWVAYLPPLPNFLLVSLCLTNFFLKISFTIEMIWLWILKLCCKYFSQIVTYPLVVSGVRGHLSFDFIVTLIYEALNCVRLDCVI